MNRPRWMRSTASRVVVTLLGLAVALVVSSTRASAPPGRYTIPGDGTVLDTKTGLTWQQTVSGTPATQSAALASCTSLSLAGTGWRLPTAFELQTIIDYSQSGASAAMIDATAFPSAPRAGFWSASPLAGASGQAWFVGFDVGGVGTDTISSPAHDVRCVR